MQLKGPTRKERNICSICDSNKTVGLVKWITHKWQRKSKDFRPPQERKNQWTNMERVDSLKADGDGVRDQCNTVLQICHTLYQVL